MNKKMQRKKIVVSWLVGVLVLALLYVLAAYVLRFRFDLTADQRYTLSESTKSILENLPKPIPVRAYFSQDLPVQFSRLRVQAQDLLMEFQAHSQGSIQLEWIDPSKDSVLRQDALDLGMQEIQVAERTRSGAVAQRGFFGLVMGDSLEQVKIPLIESIEGLEYEWMQGVRRLTGLRKRIGIIEGSGAGKVFLMEPGLGPPMPRSGMAQVFPSWSAELERAYELEYLDGKDHVSEGVELVIVAAPRRLESPTKALLESWVRQGGRLLVLAPSLDFTFSAQNVGVQVMPVATQELLWRFGVVVDTQIVLDRRHGAAFFGANPYGEPYPPFPEIREDGLNRTHDVTASLGSLLIPWTASLDTLSNPQSLGTRVLLSTSPAAWTLPLPLDLTPRQTTQGEFWERTAEAKRILALERRVLQGQDTAQIIVVSNALFATDFFMSWSMQGGETGGMENLAFLLNAVDYLAQDPDWNAVRSKRWVNRPLQEQALMHRYFWMVLNLGLVPLLLAGAALVFWKKRRSYTK